MAHIVLLGDSIFDNKAYVGSGPAVIDQLRRQLPIGWQATLRAVDGDVTADVPRQLTGVPGDATHLVISAGGNDALMQSHILGQPASSVAQALMSLRQAAAQFEQNYSEMLAAVLRTGLPATVCTIYNPRFGEANYQQVAVAALCLFNDAIIRTATRASVPLLDLRLFFTEYGDYANDIEPSVHGGAKLAERIATVVREHEFGGRTVIYS